MELITVAGTRPEIIKLADLVPLLNTYNHSLLYTGQHYSHNMKDIFFDELNLKPDYDLRCNTSEIDILRIQILKTLRTIKPSYVIVYGDTSSSLAAAQAAKQIGCKLIHIEAGVRDFDMAVPEEAMRIQIDSMADYLFCPSALCKAVLSYENIVGKVFLTGNLIVDVCKRLSDIAINRFQDMIVGDHRLPSEYLLLTIHRPENSDDPIKLEMLRKHLEKLRYRIIFPIHPRTKNNLAKFNIRLPSNVTSIEPTSYLQFLYLLKNCKLVLTDSGGVQEEAVVLRKPCITLRHTSARWETILLKANILFPLDRNDSLSDVIENMIPVKINRNPYGNNVAKATMKMIEKTIINGA
jgi:UDP-N-acetylglucosamine 2-epimerase